MRNKVILSKVLNRWNMIIPKLVWVKSLKNTWISCCVWLVPEIQGKTWQTTEPWSKQLLFIDKVSEESRVSVRTVLQYWFGTSWHPEWGSSQWIESISTVLGSRTATLSLRLERKLKQMKPRKKKKKRKTSNLGSIGYCSSGRLVCHKILVVVVIPAIGLHITSHFPLEI